MLKKNSKIIFSSLELVRPTSFIRSYSVDSKQIRLQIVKESREKALKQKIEEKLKMKKQQQQERDMKKTIKVENEKKVKSIKKDSLEKVRKLQREEKVKLSEKLKKQKEREWIQKLKKKEVEQFKEIKAKLQDKKKRKFDKNLPIRAKSAFIWFFQKNFKEIAKELKEKEGFVITQVMQEAKKKFDSLSTEEGEIYKVMAEQDKLRYEEEKKKYLSTKKAQKPHRITSPYIRFVKATRAQVVSENPSLKVTEILSALGAKWNGLSEAEKKPFVEEFEKERKEYYSEIEYDTEDETSEDSDK
jgi:hypothetical protein